MDELKMFQLFFKDKSIPRKEKTKMLRTYAKSLGMKGAGKKSGKVLIHDIAQAGGSWGSFVNFFKKAGRAIGNAGKTVYNKALKPVGNAVAKAVTEKPLTTLGKAAGIAGMIPGPWSAPLKTAGTALTAVGSAVGKGQDGGASKPLMIFN